MIYFVGMHNKPGMTPLDSRTYTGKVIDRIIAQVGLAVKTNLARTKTMPEYPDLHAAWWRCRYPLRQGDTVILLGKFVQKHFRRYNGYGGIRYIEADHPSAFRVQSNVAGYIEMVVGQIAATPAEQSKTLSPDAPPE